LAMLVLGIGLVPIMSAYMPLYREYQVGCVQSRNGTILGRNLYAFCYNFAALSGNRDIASGLTAHDQARVQACGSFGQSAQQQQQSQSNALAAAQLQQQDSRTRIDLIQKCVAPQSFPPPDVFLALTGVTSPMVSLDASVTACHAALTTSSPPLSDGTFNCSNLHQCVITCEGPQQFDMLSVTHDTSCRTEWMVHAFLLRSLLALAVYWCINISRLQLVGGMCRFGWRYLTDQGFEFVGVCSRTGKTTLQVKVHLRAAVARAVAAFEDAGTFMILIAVIAHLPYLLIMTVLTSPIPLN